MADTRDSRCLYCGARPERRGHHHRADPPCKRYAPNVYRNGAEMDSAFSITGSHDDCDPLDGANAPDDLEIRVGNLEVVSVLLAALAEKGAS